MVTFLKRRREEPVYYRAKDQHQRVIDTHRVKRCGVCTYEFPEEDMIVEDGIEKCPMCADRYTAEYLADEQESVAQVKADSAYALNNPNQFSTRSLQETIPGTVTLITDASGNALSQSSQLQVRRGGAAVTMLLVGQRFTAANVTTYSSTGITDNSPQLITPKLITLSISASGGMAPGSYGITVADGVTQNGHTFPLVIGVR